MFLQIRNFRVCYATNPMRPLGLNQFERSQASQAVRLALGMALLLALALPARSQQRPDPSYTPPFQQMANQNSERNLAELPTNDPIEKERQLRALNAERQKAMVSDADKLLKLARELDAEISRTNPESLTVDQLRKVAKIEKLARSVKDKMSTSVKGTVPNPQFPSPQFPSAQNP